MRLRSTPKVFWNSWRGGWKCLMSSFNRTFFPFPFSLPTVFQTALSRALETQEYCKLGSILLLSLAQGKNEEIPRKSVPVWHFNLDTFLDPMQRNKTGRAKMNKLFIDLSVEEGGKLKSNVWYQVLVLSREGKIRLGPGENNNTLLYILRGTATSE